MILIFCEGTVAAFLYLDSQTGSIHKNDYFVSRYIQIYHKTNK